MKTALSHKLAKGADGVEPLIEIAKTYNKALDLSRRRRDAAHDDVRLSHKRRRDETA